MKDDDNIHIEDLLFSFNCKIIVEQNSNLESVCTCAWYCRYLLNVALNKHIFHT